MAATVWRRALPRILSLSSTITATPAAIQSHPWAADCPRKLLPLAARWDSRRFVQLEPKIDVDNKVDPFGLVAEEMAQLGRRLRDMVAAEVPKLASAAEYFFKLGVEGKRFRPMVLLLMSSSLTMVLPSAAAATSDEKNWRHHKLAEITEMIHVASLLHDDVLDHADTRRGIASLNFIMGNKLAVLAGDFLLARAAFSLSTLQNDEVVGLMSKVLEHLVAGEVMQWTVDAEKSSSMDYYLQKTFYKTASLIANSCKCIAILAGHPKEVAALAFDYGRHLGLAYQLVDDLLDFTGTKASLGKPALSDLREGIATAPVLYALEEHPALQELIDRKFKDPGDVDSALKMVLASKR
ncbi:solanesyl-diphosphate synthase 1, mitochondrial [Selaginella moellendorffii]|uniref:solanesyl-diphosphate synthase 1, mitochondrial n=1 Tax=Selaginella moellendorffii TaxID=88036 RepID=UPI000D1C4539|nr:solanesyl-diphosphate synthase 1, mitochondrial [Selaginella moellendorffii]|eukprot:XP_024535909.1 solanesyl-diphosphate synthase 1, mitochondrial [Selaginella moellendorffii]